MRRKGFIIIILVISILLLNINNIYAGEHGGGGIQRGDESESGESSSTSEKHTLGDIINGANGFLSSANDNKISQDTLKNISDTIYNILLVLGIVIAIILGLILGIKFMTSGVEGQAEVKKAFIPYILGCAVVFGAFTIWKIVVDILQSM